MIKNFETKAITSANKRKSNQNNVCIVPSAFCHNGIASLPMIGLFGKYSKKGAGIKTANIAATFNFVFITVAC